MGGWHTMATSHGGPQDQHTKNHGYGMKDKHDSDDEVH